MTVGTAGTTRKAAAADEPALCQAAREPPTAVMVTGKSKLQCIGTGGAAGSGPPLLGDAVVSVKHLQASAKVKAPTTALVLLPLWTEP